MSFRSFSVAIFSRSVYRYFGKPEISKLATFLFEKEIIGN